MCINLYILKKKPIIAIIGLGYVGLPLAIEFGKKYKVLGFDINKLRIDELSKGIDRTNESDKEGMALVTGLINTDKKIKIVTHHWSDNMNKGYKIYNKLYGFRISDDFSFIDSIPPVPEGNVLEFFKDKV